jgi:osmotically-inducible protein OsmY
VKIFLLLLAVATAAVACNREESAAQTAESRRMAEAADEGQKSKPLPDASLTAIVKSALISESSLDANKIDVENKGGNIALYGSVDSPQQKEKAERIVMSVGGVKAVANHLTVRDDGAGTGTTAPARDLPEPR